MRCNPSRWLWGLLPLAVLALIVNWLERPRIEADLVNRTKEAITKASFGWAAIDFAKGGRDGIISGEPCTFKSSRLSSKSVVERIPRIEPNVRSMRVIMRVSSPWIATTLYFFSQAPRLSVAR